MPPEYGSISNEDEEDAKLLPSQNDQRVDGAFYIGDIVASLEKKKSSSVWKYVALAASAMCAVVVLRHSWRRDDAGATDPGSKSGGGGGGLAGEAKDYYGDRMSTSIPAFSTLDPEKDLGFRSTTRSGWASPSEVWGDKYLGEFSPLPTNQWYMRLVSHGAAEYPSGHVYTIPYIVDLWPHEVPKSPAQKQSASLAGINMYLPVAEASPKKIQMKFNDNRGMSLGTIVPNKSTDPSGSKGNDNRPLTSYDVDPDVPLSPLGVSLKWNHVDLKTHIVRGMPFGTMRYGKDTLPTILAGNRPLTITRDSDGTTDEDLKMMCGTFSGNNATEQDGSTHIAPITPDGKAKAYHVEREVFMHMDASDFTWVAFFSKPVMVECYSDMWNEARVFIPGRQPSEGQFQLNVVKVHDDDNKDKEEELVVQLALLNECTSGKAINKEHCNQLKSLDFDTISSKEKGKAYLETLRKGSMMYPKSPLVETQFPEEDDSEDDQSSEEDGGRVTNVVFDWDPNSVGSHGVASEAAVSAVEDSALRASAATTTTPKKRNKKGDDEFIMFAMPHHLQLLASEDGVVIEDSLCINTFHGRTCLVHGSFWNLPISHGSPQSFLADRPPLAKAIPSLAKALQKDVNFKFSPKMLRGAPDTYYTAKVLAKVGRIIEINGELQSLQSDENLSYFDADDDTVAEAASAASEVTVPSDGELKPLLDDLQQAVEIWLKPGGKAKGGAEAEFLYDATWGGFVNCGCDFRFEKGHEDSGKCNNTFPICPALESDQVNFGNAWYNDHHFHYGYMVYAAAVVAKNRPEWGRKYYERVLLYIRDIANPSADDKYFPVFRQKDWFLGNSWAGGLIDMERSTHGREQESSSEAIAAWEGVALFGSVMMNVFEDDTEEKFQSARLVRNVGEMLTAMEVSATNRYWHVWESGESNNSTSTAVASASAVDGMKDTQAHINGYPEGYEQYAVGIVYDSLALFQTWFSPYAAAAYGIQLLPFTAVSERRDDPEWASLAYPEYAKACKKGNEQNNWCDDDGWSILQIGLLAETGDTDGALEMVPKVPEKAFKSKGGGGQSLSNTIWFVATRKQANSS